MPDEQKNIKKPKSEFGRIVLALNMPIMMGTAIIAQHNPKLEPQLTQFYENVTKEFINKQIQGADSLGEYLKLDDKSLDEEL